MMVSEIPEKEMPTFIKPMSATLVKNSFSDKDWIFEIKWDGYRAIARIKGGRVNLLSRYGNLFNNHYPSIVDELEKIQNDMILDGEVIAVNENGKHSFELLQNYPKTKVGKLLFIVFDILYYRGTDIRLKTQMERKKILEEAFFDSEIVKKGEFIEADGQEFFRVLEKEGFEGMVAKQRWGIYESGKRSKNWLKIKTVQEQEVVIGGFTKPKGARQGFGALLAGVYEDGNLVYVGSPGTGFNEILLQDLFQKLSQKKVEKSPFINPPKKNGEIFWVKPEMVAQVKFREWTTEGKMRQSVFMGIREDKKPQEVIREVPWK